jgi:hypothetical protein
VNGLARPANNPLRGVGRTDFAPAAPGETEVSTILAKYLSRREAARELRKCVATLDRWRKRGEGPPYIKIGRDIYYHVSAVREWIALQGVA